YLPADTVVCLHGDVDAALADFTRETESRYRFLRGDRARPLLPPSALYLAVDQWYASLNAFSQLRLSTQGEPSTHPPADVQAPRRPPHLLAPLQRFPGATPGRVLVCADSLGRRETMLEYFREYGLVPPVCDGFAAFLAGEDRFALTVSPLNAGFEWPEAAL